MDFLSFVIQLLLFFRLIHHFKSDVADQQYQILSFAKKQLSSGGPKRLPHTFPPIIFQAFRLAYKYKELADKVTNLIKIF